ncbi:MAG: hypothetical protein QG602_656 [Verrucomicrobiota bacterium]|nr:hypothetical protein [Verrucomicrobiota bacterium]
MKNFFPLLLCALLLPVVGPAQPGADRFGDLKAKIEALLNARLQPAPLPEKPANPFVSLLPSLPVAVTPETPLETTPIPTTLDDDQVLTYAVSRLRISGLVQRAGVTHLLINSASYREADLIPLRASGDTVYYIRLVRIADTEVTFGYNQSSLTVKLPN